jgi:serine/threonine-protein kinase
MQPVVSVAHTISSILGEHFFVVPAWATWAELVVFLLVAAYLVVLLPRLKAGPAAVITLVLLAVLVMSHYLLITTQSTWLKLITPAVMLVLGHVVLTTKRFLVTERSKEISDIQSAETNRMLGLAYQGKGELDSAFASFRKVQPVDDSLLDLLYNLALDFERKRQFNKAGSVYQFVTEYNAKFRDVETRLNRSRNLEETVLLGGGSAAGGGAQGTLLLDGGGVQKPMLGRYQVEKELGKGAMGVVYLGKDPKINRTVAIKTMALSQEFEADEVDEVKERFFREAETAGRLNHPNIVTIFDAGEEHDLAYIAMEFLRGKDLAPYTKRDNLLPVPTVLDIVIKAADALDYAHAENVVHRDIKPANIMYEAESGGVKLTDFGIARITDSSKTKTGMVLGTPSYMSPEQLSGKKVDGRSDLFSLGVMLYQLLTGRLPFSGDSMATLMFKIANEPHPNILDQRPDLPPPLKAIIDKALQKSANDRYSRGAQMARDLRACQSAPVS